MIDAAVTEITPSLEQLVEQVQERSDSLQSYVQEFIHSQYERFRSQYFALQLQGIQIDYLSLLREERDKTKNILNSLLASAADEQKSVISNHMRSLSLYFRNTAMTLKEEAHQAQETPFPSLPLAAGMIVLGGDRKRQPVIRKRQRPHSYQPPYIPPINDIMRNVNPAQVLTCIIGHGLKEGDSLETIRDGVHDFFSLPAMHRHSTSSEQFLRRQVDSEDFPWFIRNFVLYDIGRSAYPQKTDDEILALPQEVILHAGLSRYMQQCNPQLETALAKYWERFRVMRAQFEEPTLVRKPVIHKKRFFSRVVAGVAAAVVAVGVGIGAYIGIHSPSQISVQSSISSTPVHEAPALPAITKQPIQYSPPAGTQPVHPLAEKSTIQWSPQQAPQNVNEPWYQIKKAEQKGRTFTYNLGEALVQEDYVVRIRVERENGRVQTLYRPAVSQNSVQVSGTVLDAGVGIKTEKGFVYVSSVSLKDHR